jgi:hypothetical protein
MWSSWVKIQYTELNLSCGNDPVVKNYIYSNADLDLWPNDPNINRVLPLPQGNYVAKFGKDPILYRTKVINLLEMQIFLWGAVVPDTFTHLKWSLVPPDLKLCCIRYSSKLFKF